MQLSTHEWVHQCSVVWLKLVRCVGLLRNECTSVLWCDSLLTSECTYVLWCICLLTNECTSVLWCDSLLTRECTDVLWCDVSGHLQDQADQGDHVVHHGYCRPVKNTLIIRQQGLDRIITGVGHRHCVVTIPSTIVSETSKGGNCRETVQLMMMSWCLMSSDVSWHIRDKLWPMPKPHGSINLYVHGNQKAR